jgi:hypothetical protein
MVLRMARPIKRGGIYSLHKKIPDDLRPILCKREEKFNLNTRGPPTSISPLTTPL